MKVGPITPVTFGYKTILSELWKKGELPTVKVGFYNGVLSKCKKNIDFCTNEHLKPHSKGGPTNLVNIVLATMYNNNKRGNSPLSEFYNHKDATAYFDQFKDVIVRYFKGGKAFIFDGNKYVEDVQKQIHDILEQEGRLDLLG